MDRSEIQRTEERFRREFTFLISVLGPAHLSNYNKCLTKMVYIPVMGSNYLSNRREQLWLWRTVTP